MQLNPSELARYARHFALPDFGMEAQLKLKASKVLVVGAGGLGSPVLLYLAAAGVGQIGIIDYDEVDETNLQRQVLYGMPDIGQSKAATAKKRLQELNPHINITTYEVALTSENALDIIASYDVVADGTDNFPTRYLVNDACVLCGKVNVYASIFRYEGQVSVFNYLHESGERGPNYRDLFPSPPPPGMVPNCAEGGVLGVLPGIIGSLQANEVIKVLTGVGEPLSGRLFLFDAASFMTRVLKVPKVSNVEITELIDYDQFCGIPKQSNTRKVKEISVQTLAQLQKAKADFQLIDVRQPYEYDICNLNGQLFPLNDLEKFIPKIDRQKQVIIHCKSGARSTQAIEQLEKQYGFTNLYNLKGGILRWAEEIDKNMPTY